MAEDQKIFSAADIGIAPEKKTYTAAEIGAQPTKSISKREGDPTALQQ